jgi:hypothetical protein
MNPKLEEAIGDPEFAKLLADSEPYFEDAQSFYRYDPPDGETICVLSGITVGSTNDKQLNKDVLQVRVSVQIQHPEELAGEEFELNGAWGWTPRNFVGLKTLASILAERPVKAMTEALDILYENEGVLLRISTSRTPNKQGGDPWVNHRVLEKMKDVDDTDPADEGQAEAEG